MTPNTNVHLPYLTHAIQEILVARFGHEKLGRWFHVDVLDILAKLLCNLLLFFIQIKNCRPVLRLGGVWLSQSPPLFQNVSIRDLGRIIFDENGFRMIHH